MERFLIESFLSGLKWRENYIFCGVDKGSLGHIFKTIGKKANHDEFCNVFFDEKIQNNLETLLDKEDEKFRKGLLADFFVSSILIDNFLSQGKIKNDCHYLLEHHKENIKILESGDYEKLIENINNFPRSYDVKDIIQKSNITEINIFLPNNRNKFLQQAINNIIYNDRTFFIRFFTCDTFPASMKMTNGEKLLNREDYLLCKFVDKDIKLENERCK